MAKINEVIYDIREGIKAFSDDSELDDRYIKYLVNTKREFFLKQRINRLGRNFNTSILQSLCLELEEVSSGECGLDLPCSKVIRTVRPLPNFIQLANGDAIQRVAPADKLSTKFNLIKRERAAYYLNSNFSNRIKAFLHNDGHIYLISSEPIHITCLSISGVFSNPFDLYNYKNCCGCTDDSYKCYDESEDEYPLDGEILDIVRTEIINQLLGRKGIQEDTINNAQDDN